MLFENRWLRRIIGGRRGIRRDWKITTKLGALLFILFSVTEIKAKTMISAGPLSRKEKVRTEQKILLGNLEKKRKFGKPNCT
jgi:hypothetical protein